MPPSRPPRQPPPRPPKLLPLLLSKPRVLWDQPPPTAGLLAAVGAEGPAAAAGAVGPAAAAVGLVAAAGVAAVAASAGPAIVTPTRGLALVAVGSLPLVPYTGLGMPPSLLPAATSPPSVGWPVLTTGPPSVDADLTAAQIEATAAVVRARTAPLA
ncbi:hypothetical protein PR202_ga13509 [Eleusine coracana subsp. coracana]|uniref:Uncharacterized protein n=1 Tax=Eleusine coracana subsp. coracana TaxID=191504 RepID=A0AAV5CEG5_ELECO|nr:hypothetical protein PR202_ga13509 [Eleusine coracana subsp. coracana]